MGICSETEADLSLRSAKAMMHAHVARGGRIECDMKRMYSGLCGITGVDFSPGWEYQAESDTPVIELCLEDMFYAPREDCPTIIRDMTVLDDGDLAGIEEHRKIPVRIDLHEGVRTIDLPECNKAVSMQSRNNGFLILDKDKCRILETDSNFKLITIHRLPESVEVSDRSVLCATSDGLALVNIKEKSIAFLDREFSLRSGTNLDHISLLHEGFGYEEGVLLFEWFPGKIDYGELIWVDASGDILPLAGGFTRPSGFGSFPGGLLVCDFAGLHLLHMDGLALTLRQFMPWRPLMDAVGLRSGIGHEAIIRNGVLHVKFKLISLLLPRSKSYCIAKFIVRNDEILMTEENTYNSIPRLE